MSNRAGWNDEIYHHNSTKCLSPTDFAIVVAEGIKIHTAQCYLNLSTRESGKETCMNEKKLFGENVSIYCQYVGSVL